MSRVLIAVGLIAGAVIIALVVGGVSGGPEARRRRLFAHGKWLGIFLTGVMFGLPLAGFFLIASSPAVSNFYAGINDAGQVVMDVVVIAVSLSAGALFGRVMWAMQARMDIEMPAPGVLSPAPAEPPAKPRSIEALLADALPDTATGNEARRLLDERRRAILWSRIVGGGGAVAIVAIGLLIALQERRGRLVGGPVALFAAAYFHYQVISSWFRASPRSLLLLRRFTDFDDRRFVLARVMGEVCRALAVPVTVQDESFRGDVPISLQALQRYIGLPLAVGAPLLLMIYLPGPFLAFGAVGAAACYVVLTIGIYWVFNLLAARRAVVRGTRRNYKATVQKMFRRLKRRTAMYSGTRVMKFTNDCWREAVELCVDEADCVVIDVTDVSENVAWEIQAVYRRVPPEAVLLTWELEENDHASQDAGVRSIPAHSLRRLAAIVPEAMLQRSRRFARPATQNLVAAALLHTMWPSEIAQCMAARMAGRTGVGETRLRTAG